jgi:predicted Zn-dependent peptidase
MKHTAKIIKLDKGAELLVINVPNASIAGFGIGVRAGANYAPKDKAELPHLFEHMMFNGNKKYPNQDDFSYQLEKNGTNYNAHTGSTTIDFIYTTGNEFIKQVIKLAFIQITSPIFDDAGLINQKKIIQRELEPSLDDPYMECFYSLQNAISENVYTTAERLKSLDLITIEDISSYYKKYFVSENTKFVLFGSFTTKEIDDYVKQIDKELINYPSGERQPIVFPSLKNYRQKMIVNNSKKAERNCLDITFVNPSYNLKIAPAIKIFYALFNDGTYSRMFRRIRREGVGYSFKGGYSFDKHYSEFYFTDKSSTDHSVKIFEIALEELTDLRSGNFTEEELERARGYVIGNLEKIYSTANDLARWYVSDFAHDEALLDFSKYLEEIKKMTKEDVVKSAKEFVIVDDWVLSLLGPDMKGKEQVYVNILKKEGENK